MNNNYFKILEDKDLFLEDLFVMGYSEALIECVR